MRGHQATCTASLTRPNWDSSTTLKAMRASRRIATSIRDALVATAGGRTWFHRYARTIYELLEAYPAARILATAVGREAHISLWAAVIAIYTMLSQLRAFRLIPSTLAVPVARCTRTPGTVKTYIVVRTRAWLIAMNCKANYWIPSSLTRGHGRCSINTKGVQF